MINPAYQAGDREEHQEFVILMVSPQLHRVGGTVFVKSEWPAELVVLPRSRQTIWQLRAWGNCDVNEMGRRVTRQNRSRRWDRGDGW